MDNSSVYPDIYSQARYGLQKQAPSYQTEFPNDLPYDPGVTSSFFELNYFPTSGSQLLLIIPITLLVIFLVMRRRLRSDLGQIGFVGAMALVFFGPLRLPSPLPFNTTLGMVKGMGLILGAYVGLQWVLRRVRFDLFAMPSLLRVGLYVVSLMLSVFVMTNPTFFLQDFEIVVTGLLFFVLGYVLFTWDMGAEIILWWARLLFIPAGVVLLIFVSNGIGKEIMALLFQRYENFVFMHDLARGRIFSVIDFEYFVPCVAAFFAYRSLRKNPSSPMQYYVLTALSFVAILLVNYRYRFLTYALGLGAISLFLKQHSVAIRKATILLVVVLGGLYMVLSFMFFRSTLLDRFLVRNYYEDQVSIDRRFVMYRQAWELFMQKPILGVGLGNYKDNVQIVYSRFGGRTYEPYYKILQNVYAYPHNWFLTVLAENGIIGFAVLMWMLYQFFLMDVRLHKVLSGDKHVTFFILSAVGWLYVFANLFTMMHVSLPTVIVFWACRGMIERMYKERFLVRGEPK